MAYAPPPPSPEDPVACAYLLGLIVGEGSFGGDGRQPQVVLRMHVRHVAVFRWLVWSFPGGRLYGPYCHGGRRYLQWMARGVYLREVIAPLIQRHQMWLDDHARDRFQAMCDRYAMDRGTGPSSPEEVGVARFRRNPRTAGDANL
ncbi:MAG: hypothetical protein ABR564_04180 [Candidatus Dormibacteria bacterium]